MSEIQPAMRWFAIAQADRSITDIQDFSEVGIILRNSDRHWVRDADGRVYEASWTDDKAGYWWDWVGESPVDPVEFMPHPLDPRFATPSPSDHAVAWMYEKNGKVIVNTHDQPWQANNGWKITPLGPIHGTPSPAPNAEVSS